MTMTMNMNMNMTGKIKYKVGPLDRSAGPAIVHKEKGEIGNLCHRPAYFTMKRHNFNREKKYS